jgi:hypothetical protein
METRKLTQEEVDRLFDFCTKHYVPEYDLQIELVDHLASGIEEQWIENPELPFPVARNNTFDRFGIFGFSKIKSQKEKELRRKYRKLFWQFTLEFYKLPKIILTIALTTILFTSYRLINNFFWLTISLMVLALIFIIGYNYWYYPRTYKVEVKKPLLLFSYLNNRQTELSFFFQIPLLIIQWNKVLQYSFMHQPIFALIASFFIVTLGILMYVAFLVVPQKLKEHINEQFPQLIEA